MAICSAVAVLLWYRSGLAMSRRLSNPPGAPASSFYNYNCTVQPVLSLASFHTNTISKCLKYIFPLSCKLERYKYKWWVGRRRRYIRSWKYCTVCSYGISISHDYATVLRLGGEQHSWSSRYVRLFPALFGSGTSTSTTSFRSVCVVYDSPPAPAPTVTEYYNLNIFLLSWGGGHDSRRLGAQW